MDFIKMIMELPGEKRSQDVVEHTEWNSLWKLIVTQGNHSENYLEQLYDYFFNKEGWVNKVQAELDGVQPYLKGVMTQPVGKAPDGSLWTYPSTESGTVPWGNIMGDITKQQDLIQKFNTKSDVGHSHDINTLTFTTGDIDGSWLADDSIGETAYGSQSVPTRAIKDLSVTSGKLSNGAVTTAKIASSAVINDSIANGSVSGAKIANGAITRVKFAQDALNNPRNLLDNSDFTNLVAQAVIGGNHGSVPYAADRWILDSGTVSYEAGAGLTLNGTIRQKLEFSPTKATSAFVGVASGTASISYADGAVIITSSGGVLKWAALYVGSYTDETMPEYQPKGYGAELAECMRYYLRLKADVAVTMFGVFVMNLHNYAQILIPVPQPLRILPTLSFTAGIKVVYNSTVSSAVSAKDGKMFVVAMSANCVWLRATVSEMMNTESGYIASSSTSDYIELSADL